MLARLELLSLSYDHRHSPGYVVAQTLAAGLRQNDRAQIQFAERYLLAFETLTRDLQEQGLSRSAIRKEVADRANMSDGATGYLVRFLESGFARAQGRGRSDSTSRPTNWRTSSFAVCRPLMRRSATAASAKCTSSTCLTPCSRAGPTRRVTAWSRL